MKIFLDTRGHFEDDKYSCGRVTVRAIAVGQPKLPQGNPTRIQALRSCGGSPLRNHTPGPYLPARMAQFFAAIDTRGALRGKKRELELALDGSFTDNQRWLLDKELRQLEWLETQAQVLEQEIECRVAPFEIPCGD